MRAERIFATYRKNGPPVVICAMVAPLYTAPLAAVGFVELSTTTNASLGRSLGLIPGPQATMVPSSVTKMKAAPAFVPFAWNVNPAAPEKTTPVGVPGTPSTGDGIFTTSPSV